MILTEAKARELSSLHESTEAAGQRRRRPAYREIEDPRSYLEMYDHEQT